MDVGLRSSSRDLKLPYFDGSHRGGSVCKSSHVVAHFLRNVPSRRMSRGIIRCTQLLPGHSERSLMGKKQMIESPPKLDFVRTLLIDNYDSYTYNIYQELSVINGIPPVVIQNDGCTWEEIYRLLYEDVVFDNIVISPGPGSPTCPADIGICLQLLLKCWNIPILGVCLGHQALGFVHGARVVHASEPVHGRLSEIEHDGSKLFDGLPSGKNSGFKVVRYHSLVIDPDTLPEELVPIAWTCGDTIPLHTSPNGYSPVDYDPVGKNFPDMFLGQRNGDIMPFGHPGTMNSKRVLMGIMHSTRPHYGVQFHPESVGTHLGRRILENFRQITVDYWSRPGASIFRGRNSPYTACIQVPNACTLLRRIQPRSKQATNITADHLLDGPSQVKQIAYDLVDKTRLGLSHRKSLLDPHIDSKVLKVTWRRLDEPSSEFGGAENIFCQLFALEEGKNTFWLDSSSTEKGRARFSFMGTKGGSLWKQMTFRLSQNSKGGFKGCGYLDVEDSSGSISSLFLENGFLDFLNEELSSFRHNENDVEGLPFHFYGGFVGYIGYDLKVECGAETNPYKSKAPDACFFFADNLLVVDHVTDEVYLLSVDDATMSESAWLDDMERKLLGLKAAPAKVSEHTSILPGTITPSEAGFNTEKSRDQYMGDVEKCMEYIKDGESYELCLTNQITKKVEGIDPLGFYLFLRKRNAAPYAAWLNFSKENLSICCSSPERFLRLDSNGILEAKPIKGTIARGATADEDRWRKLQLQYSEKDQAENLMIVDLLRNDLGRVCEPGSVHVPRLMDVESYATVHTMVSTIRGKKRDDMTAIDCIRAAFPGGSMTGAPKLRSMEILDSIETSSRGIYSGSIGFFSINQTFDLNIVIRTVVIHNNEASIGAGGAVVALSDPEAEYDEMVLKTQALVKAVMEFQ
ncbi:hypothetical protein MLD38_008658 [Melastoma candidum]|uniref:Uncharacterized protein n=1 Tax=Melastoma candidum TaxID=119954 RepID=A0ACB9RWF2_9MYRT|nr:hypothetical protein MLD38_008658 [Melastoma candidum]